MSKFNLCSVLFFSIQLCCLFYGISYADNAEVTVTGDIDKQRQAAIYYTTARKKHREFDYTNAIVYYAKVLKLYPDNRQVYIQSGNSRNAIKDYSGAIDDYTSAIKLNPDEYRAYYQRGRTHISIGNLVKGCKDLFKAKSLGSIDAERFINQFCT